MLKAFVKFLQALNSNRNPSEVANALCMGILLGFMPKTNALWFVIFIFFFFVRINKPAYLIMIALMSQLTWLLDPLFDDIGYKILTIPGLANFFGNLLEVPFVGLTKFNNSIVMGSLVCGLALYIPLFICFRYLVLLWRKKVTPKLGDSAVMKVMQKLPLIGKIIDIAAERL
ncbi:MAG: TIGR03546 family protein [Treponema sp.]|nr:TIGR03546 family protein [Candidatus Treponema scatequi]